MNVTVIILMAGSSERFGISSKQFIPLGKRPLYQWAIDTFSDMACFSELIAVVPPENPIPLPIRSVPGGVTRQLSSFAGICACSVDTDFVMIHDAARPFVSKEIIQKHLDAMKEHKAINTCAPCPDTINYVEEKQVIAIPDRRHCMLGQTPQSFAYDLIVKAHRRTKQQNATDDCSLVLELGHPVHVVSGEYQNFKITTALDLTFAKTLLQEDATETFPLNPWPNTNSEKSYKKN